jgi:septal ring factor EnvC (AmiA/AmiB activator)
MGNLISSKSKARNPRYELFLSTEQSLEQNSIIQRMDAEIRLLRADIAQQVEKRERLEMKLAKMETYIQSKHTELINSQMLTNEKINIMAKDMENLLNNDKLLLDKLIEKNIVTTIQEEESGDDSINTDMPRIA